MRAAVVALMVLLGLGGVICVVTMAGAESPAARAADGALFLVDVGAVTALSFLIWPGRA